MSLKPQNEYINWNDTYSFIYMRYSVWTEQLYARGLGNIEIYIVSTVLINIDISTSVKTYT